MPQAVRNVDRKMTYPPRRTPLKKVMPYVGALLLTFLVLEVVFKFYAVDLTIPFCYVQDNLWDLQVMKGEINKEWSLLSWVPKSPYVGAPFGQSLYDFPGWADAGQIFLFVKLLSFFTKNVFLISNGFTLFTYFSTALTALYAFRYYRIPYSIALVFSALFNFLPYHLLRMGWGHPLLSSIYEIPMMALIILWIGSAKPIFFKRVEGRYRLDFKNRKAIITIVVALLSSLSNIYYNFFFGSLAMVAGVRAAVQRKSWHHLLAPIIMMVFVCGSVLITLSPYLIYRHNNGINETGMRASFDTEIFGLKIAQMLMPVDGHRVGVLAKLKEKYNTHPLINENASATLGIVGSAGLLFLLGYFFFAGKSFNTVYNKLALLSISATLLGTIGGFAAILGVLGFSYFRCNNRISLFIGFYALLALAFLATRLRRSIPTWAFYAGLTVLFVISIYDQSPSYAGYFSYNYFGKVEEFKSDRAFIKEIEKVAPKGSLIFQLPYMGFPEGPCPDGVYFYDHFKGYLHADSELYWSFGSVRGTGAAKWYESTANAPVDPMLRELKAKNFSGIYIDRYAYQDGAAGLEAEFIERLHKEPLVSMNERLSYFDMSGLQLSNLKDADAAPFEAAPERSSEESPDAESEPGASPGQ